MPVVLTKDNDETIELNFVFDWTVQVMQPVNGFNVFGDNESFYTSYRGGSYEWTIHLYRTHVGQPPSPKVQLYLEQGRTITARPTPKECNFSFRLMKADRTECVWSQSVKANRTRATFPSIECFRVPISSKFVDSLTRCFMDSTNAGRTVILTVDLIFDANSFDMCWVNSNSAEFVPPPPADTSNDFRFKVLREESADFVVHCRDGDVTTSKSALFLSSDYFRYIFSLNDENMASTEYDAAQYNKWSIQKIIEFMITGTFEMPENLTPEMAQEFITVAALFKPINRERLRNTIHRALCCVLAQDFSNLEKIVVFLAFAHEMNLIELKMLCISLIVTEHYRRFRNQYNEETTDMERRLLYERLRRSGFLLNSSPMSKIENILRHSRKCRVIRRQGHFHQNHNNTQQTEVVTDINDIF